MMRKAFSMITAIFIIIIMATVALLVMNISGKIVKETTLQFRKEQAMLLARSYTELAVLAVTDYNRTTASDCVENIDGVVNALTPGISPDGTATSTNGFGYDVETRIYYIGKNLPCSNTKKLNNSTNVNRSSTLLTTTAYDDAGKPDAVAAVIIDVYVKYKDPDAANPANSPWFTYHRRTLQKI